MPRDLFRSLPLSRRLGTALSLFVLAIAVGTGGYVVLSGMTLVDALYQTVTTLSTVGFRELKPFGTVEKLFTICLILVGVGTVLYTLTLIVEEALEGDLRGRFYIRRMELEIEKLRGHYILCGFGRVGREIARELKEREVPFVIIERTPEVSEYARAAGYLVVDGDATQEEVLVTAGLRNAHSLLAASDSDAINTYITLTARAINSTCFIVGRVSDPNNEEKLRLAGADRILSLYSMGGRRMVLSALQPLAADFMDTIASGRHGDLLLTEFQVDSSTGLAGSKCGALIEGAHNATVLGIRNAAGVLAVGPKPETPLHEGDIVIVLAEEADISRIKRENGHRSAV